MTKHLKTFEDYKNMNERVIRNTSNSEEINYYSRQLSTNIEQVMEDYMEEHIHDQIRELVDSLNLPKMVKESIKDELTDNLISSLEDTLKPFTDQEKLSEEINSLVEKAHDEHVKEAE